jgi:hypothetical protein
VRGGGGGGGDKQAGGGVVLSKGHAACTRCCWNDGCMLFATQTVCAGSSHWQDNSYWAWLQLLTVTFRTSALHHGDKLCPCTLLLDAVPSPI